MYSVSKKYLYRYDKILHKNEELVLLATYKVYVASTVDVH